MAEINIFLIHTEYHLMMSVHIAASHFSSSTFINRIYISKSKRLQNNLNYDSYANIEFVDLRKFTDHDRCNLLVTEDCSRFFFFQENSIFNRFIAFNLRKKGTKIVLAPDGLKPYVPFDKTHAFMSLTKDTFNDYITLIKNKLPIKTVYLSDYYHYGRTRFIDELWLTHPDMFDKKKNKTHAKIVKINNFDKKTMDSLSKLFDFSNEDLPAKDSCIFYLNQPFTNPILTDTELSFISDLRKKFDLKHKMYIKIHPLTKQTTIERYKSIDGIDCFQSTVPAELYIHFLSNSIVISGWSTGLAIDNVSCAFYYIYPIYMDKGDRLLSQITINPMNHIKVVNNVESIEFPK